jgi:hypothetical protein
MLPCRSRIVTHPDPVWRDRTNFITRLDLAQHDAPGLWEQCWTHTEDQQQFEMCCIPFRAYGISLGDVLHIEPDNGTHRVVAKSGRRTIRFLFSDDEAAHRDHDRLHRALVERLGCLVEFRGMHYAAIDLADAQQEIGVIEVLAPLLEVGKLRWEWADPPLPS